MPSVCRGILRGRGLCERPRASARILACVVMVLLVASLAMLSGCKYSDVLTQHIEDPENGVLDENAEPIYKSNPNAPERPDLADVTVDESDDENEQEDALPEYDPEGESDDETAQRMPSDETPHDANATEGAEGEDPDREGDGTDEDAEAGEEPDEEDEEETGSGDDPEGNDEESDEGDQEGEGDPLTDDEADEPQDDDEAGTGQDTVIVDPDDGTKDEVAKGTIAAVGEYATIAQMLGGAGALAACDQEWLDTCNATGMFAGELERVEVAFSGDGTEAGACDVDALVDTVKPSVVLWDSTANEPALSEADRASLQQAGITVQAVPHIGEQTTEDYTVTSAVQEVAAVLSGASGLALDPANTLSEYLSFHDGVLTDCYNSNDGFSYKVTDSQYSYLYQNTPLSGLTDSTTTRVATVYVEDMMQPGTSSAEVAQTATTSEGVIRLANDGKTLDVSDGVGLSATTNTSSYMLMDYYLQLAGVMNNSYDADKPESQGRPYIIMPGSTDAFGRSQNYASRSTASALFYNAGDGTVTANWHVLGNADFPAVLASTQEVADAIVSSASKEDGLYHMESPYQVIVVPTGVAGPWSEGHIDSFLLAPWAFRIANSANLSAAAGYAQNFYGTFLRCSSWDSAITDWDSAYTAG